MIIYVLLGLCVLCLECVSEPSFLVLYVEDINLLTSILPARKASHVSRGTPHDELIRRLYDEGHLPGFSSFLKRSVGFSRMFSEGASAATTAALLTGELAVESGFVQGKILPFKEIPSLASTGGLSTDKETIAKVLQSRDYFTAYIGFWKLGFGEKGINTPLKHGFDFWTGVPAAHSGHCRGVGASERHSSVGFKHQYLDVMYTTLPFWLTMALGIVSLYFLNKVSLKVALNCLLYLYCGTCVFYLALEAFFAIKPSTCVLFHENVILSQPYHAENLTLHLTSTAVDLIGAASDEKRNFYIHVNYLHMRKPHFASRIFQRNSSDQLDKFLAATLELDWSIQKIMKALDENHMLENTVIFLTGSNNCDLTEKQNRGKLQDGFVRKGHNQFYMEKVEQISTLEDCFRTPFYVYWKKLTGSRLVSAPVAITDVFSTILHLSDTPSHPLMPGRSLLPLFAEDPRYFHSQNRYVASLTHFYNRGMDSNSPQNQQCPANVTQLDLQMISANFALLSRLLQSRKFYFYETIVKPSAVLLDCQYWVIFSPKATENSYPSIIDFFPRATDGSSISNETLEAYYQLARQSTEEHVSHRTNRWSSQFEMPLHPWIFPCANFPRCQQVFDLIDFSLLDDFKNN